MNIILHHYTVGCCSTWLPDRYARTPYLYIVIQFSFFFFDNILLSSRCIRFIATDSGWQNDPRSPYRSNNSCHFTLERQRFVFIFHMVFEPALSRFSCFPIVLFSPKIRDKCKQLWHVEISVSTFHLVPTCLRHERLQSCQYSAKTNIFQISCSRNTSGCVFLIIFPVNVPKVIRK